MKNPQIELIKDIHNAMINSAKNPCKNKVEPYDYGSAEYNEVAKMLEATFGPITSTVLSILLNNPSEYVTLCKYVPKIEQKMPVQILQNIDDLDILMTNEGKLGQYHTICATAELAAGEVGNSLMNGCIQTYNNASTHTQSNALSDESLDIDTYSPRAVTA